MAYGLKTVKKVTIIDANSEKILEIVTRVVTGSKDAKYFIMNTDFVVMTKDLSAAEFKMLLWLAASLNMDSNLVTLNAPEKQKLMDDMEIGESSVQTSISSFIRKGFLYRKKEDGDRSARYYMNPTFFWRGNGKRRYAAIKEFLIMHYDKDKIVDLEGKINHMNLNDKAI